MTTDQLCPHRVPAALNGVCDNYNSRHHGRTVSFGVCEQCLKLKAGESGKLGHGAEQRTKTQGVKTYSISAIKRKAERIKDGHLYLEDCIALSDSWDEAGDEAIFSDTSVEEIRATWEPKTVKNHRPCKSCGGLR